MKKVSDTNVSNLSAIALTYPDYADAPLIAVKAKGAVASKMLEIAREYEIPVVEDEMLANVLSVQDVGACVPEETWQTVAKVFAFISEVSHARKN